MCRPSIIIRADASTEMGTGHVMRCITLADELRRRGGEVLFISRALPGHLINFIRQNGYNVVGLAHSASCYAPRVEDVAHAGWLQCSWEQDASDTITAIADLQPEWVIVDHYALDHRWEKTLRTTSAKIMVVDDLADRIHDCDILLDQNMFEDPEKRYEKLVSPTCIKLFGPKYALLRPEFLQARKSLRTRDGRVNRIFVFFGGVDPANETGKTLEALAAIKGKEFVVDVVVSGSCVHQENIRSFCSANERFNFHCQVQDISRLMAAADLAVGAGGSSTWERCSLGLPCIVLAISDNQLPVAKCAAEHNLLFYLGESSSVSSKDIQKVVEVLQSAPTTLSSYSRTSLATVDARGVHRVATLIMPPTLTVREAQEQDCEPVYQWRNAEETRRFFFDADPIPYEKHQAWYQKVLLDPDRVLLIGEINGESVGVLRYDIEGEQAVVSVYLVPGIKGQGVGTELIHTGSDWIRSFRKDVKKINAEIMPANIGSLKAFEQAGYQQKYLIYEHNLEH